jgi:type IX secretion system PorP/SprF family membrane protein
MKSKQVIIFLACITVSLVGTCHVYAQEDPLYSQYMFNGTMINPAYPTMDEATSMTAVLRNQWVGLEGAPKTGSFTFSTPFRSTGTNMGGLLCYDKIGNINQTSVAFNIGQKVTIGEELFLGMGLRLGQSFYREDNTIFNTEDPVYHDNKKYTKTDVGFGFMLFSPRFFLGLSSPTFQSLATVKNQVYTIQRKSHYYLQAAYLYDISENVKLKPNVLLKYVNGSPLQVDLNLNALFAGTLWGGLSWRSSQTVTGILQLQITPNLEAGYSYDYNYGKTMSQIQYGSHELMINFRLANDKSNRVVTPRYF